MPEQIKLETYTQKGTKISLPATIEHVDGKIEFIKSPFALKDEIKSMKGSHWCGYDDPARKIWSVEDCQRNRMQLDYLQGKDVYAHFDQDLVKHEYRELTRNGKPAKLMEHQKFLADTGLTYHYQVWAAEMRTGKTISAQMVIEKSGVDLVYWVGPKTSLPNIKREFKMWRFPSSIEVEFFTYEGFVRVVDEWDDSQELPRFVVFDEASRCKNHTSQRSQAAQRFSDMIRAKYGMDGYVIEMSGTPSPKAPTDWWSLAEIAYPGFLKEGSAKAMETRLAFLVDQTFDAGTFKKRTGWRDDENKCNVCGLLEGEGPHTEFDDDYHRFEPSINEVALLGDRLKGLVTIKHRKDCMEMPEVQYRKILCKPSESLLRVAEAIVASAPNAMTGMTLLRELSDGFQYRDIVDGKTACTYCTDGTVEVWKRNDPNQDHQNDTYTDIDMLDPEFVASLVKETISCPMCHGTREVDKRIRIAKEIPCPKEKALKMLLDENEEQGRIVIFAGFTGSVDRIAKICLKEKWDVVRCDQGTFQILTHDGREVKEEPLDFWANLEHPRVAFDANPESGGMSLTLNEARTSVYWSNTWKPEYRVQSEARINPTGDDNHGIQIVDLIHLPSDERMLNVIRENRRIELMTMGEIMEVTCDGEGEVLE